MHPNCHHPPFVVVSDAQLNPEQQRHYTEMLTGDPREVLIVDQREAGVQLDVIECSWCENPEAVRARHEAFSGELLELPDPDPDLLVDAENWLEQALTALDLSTQKGADLLVGMGQRIRTRLLERMERERPLPPMDFEVGMRVTPEQFAEAGYTRGYGDTEVHPVGEPEPEDPEG